MSRTRTKGGESEAGVSRQPREIDTHAQNARGKARRYFGAHTMMENRNRLWVLSPMRNVKAEPESALALERGS